MNFYETLLAKQLNGGGGGSDTRWQEIGYSEEPAYIQDAIDYAKELQEAWLPSTTPNRTKCVFMPYVNFTSTSAESLFYQAYRLAYVPLFETSQVTTMRLMFYKCPALTSVPLFDTQNVTNMESMFSECYSLQSVPLFNTSKVTNMQSMFSQCYALHELPLFDTSKVENMIYFMSSAYNLSTIPLFDTTSLKNMTGAFQRVSLSRDSLNNILAMCANATNYANTKTLTSIGVASNLREICPELPNWQAFVDAGWSA